jgi:quinol monooxygenase YgiN
MLLIVKIVPVLKKRKELLDILLSIKGPTLAVSGCLDCCICEEQGDEYTIIYLEKWLSSELLYRHIRSDLYSRILEAMELSRETPEVFVVDIAKTKGMKLIREIRKVER